MNADVVKRIEIKVYICTEYHNSSITRAFMSHTVQSMQTLFSPRVDTGEVT